MYGCGNMKYGKLGLVVSADDDLSLSIPRIIGTKSVQFKNIVEIKAGIDHSLALNFDYDPDEEASTTQNRGAKMFTFGQDKLGVLGQGKRGVSIVGIPYMIKNVEFYFHAEQRNQNVDPYKLPKVIAQHNVLKNKKSAEVVDVRFTEDAIFCKTNHGKIIYAGSLKYDSPKPEDDKGKSSSKQNERGYTQLKLFRFSEEKPVSFVATGLKHLILIAHGKAYAMGDNTYKQCGVVA